MPLIPVALVVVAFAVGGVAYLYFEGLGPAGRRLAALRGAAGALLALLLLDLTCARSGDAGRPLVLVDGSLSMDAAGGHGAEARDSAGRWGEVRYFGAYPTGDSTASRFGRSSLAPALLAATALDRPVIVVTDGVIPDLDRIPADLLARVAIRTFPRDTLPDVAIVRVDAPERVTLGDTLRVAVSLARTGGGGTKATLELQGPRGASLARRAVTLGAAGGSFTLSASTRGLGPGDHLLRVVSTVAGDAEAGDDAKGLLVRVTQLPGAVLLAAPPDWDARQLHATLRDVAALPVKGFARFGASGWRAMEDLRRVSPEEVQRAARGADLLVVKGDPSVARGAHPKGLWWWPSGEGGETQLDGDWYLTIPTTPTPIAAGWSGVVADSLTPLTRVTPIEPDPRDWVGATVQLGRRGAERPVVLGKDSAGIRVLQVAADGFWRWGFRPGSAEEAYRQFVSSSVNWLLGAAEAAQGGARPVRSLTPFGIPITFERTPGSTATALRITVTGDSSARIDTLRFDGAGRAELPLPPGRYNYQLEDGGRGVVAVDRWSEEYVPQAPSLSAQATGVVAGVTRTALRDQWWVYGLVVALFCLEWWLRRRAGLR